MSAFIVFQCRVRDVIVFVLCDFAVWQPPVEAGDPSNYSYVDKPIIISWQKYNRYKERYPNSTSKTGHKTS